MGLLDSITNEDRIQVKFSDFYRLMKEATKAEMLTNGIKCDTPHAYMREMMTGKREEAAHATSELSESNLPWETSEQETEETEEEPEAETGGTADE